MAGKNGRFYSFRLENPRNMDIDGLAESIIGSRDVEEVYVSDGEGSFVVKARFADGREPKDIRSYMSRSIGRAYGHVNKTGKYLKR